MPQDELPSFPALAHLAESGFLAPDAWNCRKLQVSLKVAIELAHAARVASADRWSRTTVLRLPLHNDTGHARHAERL